MITSWFAQIIYVIIQIHTRIVKSALGDIM